MNQRLASLDVVRLMALAAIVWGHTFAPSEAMDRALLTWHLPIFFVLTGYFWSDRRSPVDVARNRFRTLLIPYACWFVLITVLSVPRRWDGGLGGLADSVALAALGGNFAKQPYTTFWFFTALFAAAVGYRILRTMPATVRLLVVAAGLVVNIVAGDQLARIPLALGTALGALAFVEIGRWARSLEATLQSTVRAAAAAGVLVVVAVLLVLLPGNFVPMDMKSGQFPLAATVLTLVTTAAIVVLAGAWTTVPPGLAAVVTPLATPGLMVIFLHPLVLFYLGGSGLPVPVVFAIALVVPLLLGLLVVRTPLAPWLLGVERTARPATATRPVPVPR